MSEALAGCCVLLPCSSERSWVVPQRCLGEIVTVPSDGDQPPNRIAWRGEMVPVVDFGPLDTLPWRDHRAGTGLVAVVLGLREQGCRYFGVAVRGSTLGVSELADADMEDLPDGAQDYCTAVFRMNGTVYQVPDLLALQRAIGAGELQFQ